ncbi:MAG: HlyD family efflux transporter periplasmic adaptor subunit [Deltaproteobacteria bacterium]|nr:HlyD family efflux transporter periplasmic adaptor subunit [Deltaproteobacteria bacterium]
MKPHCTLALTALTLACTPAARAPSHAPAAHTAHSDGLAIVTLTAQAAQRLELQIAVVQAQPRSVTRLLVGEVLAPPGRAFALTAPVAGTVQLSPAARALRAGSVVAAREVLVSITPFAPADRDVHAQALRLVALAQARVDVAQARARRAEAMVQGLATSVRAVEEARGELAAAQAELRAASRRVALIRTDAMAADVHLALRAPTAAVVRAMYVTHGQAVAANAPIIELVDTGARWVRVPVPVAEVSRVDRALRVQAHLEGSAPVTLEALQGPPTADFATGTVDRWFALGDGPAWAPGTRVQVTVQSATVAGEPARVTVPMSAVLLDALGGASVYVALEPLRFARRSVVLGELDGDTATVRAGLTAGTSVVVQAVSELAGVEAPGGH